MRARIRKLNKDDCDSLGEIDNYKAKIIIEELQDDETDYLAYGVFEGYDTLVGFCGLSHSSEYETYKYWDDNSRCISELYLSEGYDIETYCDLLNYILTDESNIDSNIYFENHINLKPSFYEQLGFVALYDGTLVRLSEENLKKLNKEE